MHTYRSDKRPKTQATEEDAKATVASARPATTSAIDRQPRRNMFARRAHTPLPPDTWAHMKPPPQSAAFASDEFVFCRKSTHPNAETISQVRCTCGAVVNLGRAPSRSPGQSGLTTVIACATRPNEHKTVLQQQDSASRNGRLEASRHRQKATTAAVLATITERAQQRESLERGTLARTGMAQRRYQERATLAARVLGVKHTPTSAIFATGGQPQD